MTPPGTSATAVTTTESDTADRNRRLTPGPPQDVGARASASDRARLMSGYTPTSGQSLQRLPGSEAFAGLEHPLDHLLDLVAGEDDAAQLVPAVARDKHAAGFVDS